MGAHTRPNLITAGPAAIAQAALSWEHLPTYERIASMLHTPPHERDEVLIALHVIWLAHELQHGNPVAQAKLREAVAEIIAALKTIARASEVIGEALLNAPPGDQAQTLEALHSAFIRSVLPLHTVPAKPPNAIVHTPLRGEHARMAAAFEQALVEIGFGDLKSLTRSPDPALDVVIWRLARLYRELTGRKPTADSKSGAPKWRSPFARIVEAFWPTIRDIPAPANSTIAAALRRVTSPAANIGDCAAPAAVSAQP